MRVGHGLYQYAPEKVEGFQSMFKAGGILGIENLVFTRIVNSGKITTANQKRPPSNSKIATIPTTVANRPAPVDPATQAPPEPREGYPKILPTGQEIQWIDWPNGTEQVSFVSHGRPFPPPLILYILDQMKAEGFNGDGWLRTSIEVNIDGRNIKLTPESITLQQTEGLLFKVYNHGQQARLEIAERRPLAFGDSVVALMNMVDLSDTNEMGRRLARIEEAITALQKVQRLPISIARKAREKADEALQHVNKAQRDTSGARRDTQKDQAPSPPSFTTARALHSQRQI